MVVIYMNALTRDQVEQIASLSDAHHQGGRLSGRAELVESIESLSVEQRCELQSLMWLGCGGWGEARTFEEIVEHARDNFYALAEFETAYLLLRPRLGLYLRRGLERVDAAVCAG